MKEPLKISTYKVIADFPGSMHKIGDVINVYANGGRTYVVEVNDCSGKYDIRDFPHLYKEIID